jgi:hypothetical protein
LSGENREVIVETIHSKLMEVGEKVRNGEIPVELYHITKVGLEWRDTCRAIPYYQGILKSLEHHNLYIILFLFAYCIMMPG